MGKSIRIQRVNFTIYLIFQLQDLVCQILQGHLVMFRKDTFLSILSKLPNLVVDVVFSTELTLCILETLKLVLWQSVKTQMKCCKMQHFIRFCPICLDKINLED